ncbi:YceI family protein [Novosphingobium huizhouense]|uniref:YceI family protein n=1 Tax=Novosphingobium huizhouense TaxID=2866625 RepID=UPI001CD8965C|nr:YceI family protein [Novosphingobium huizhouense]
MFSFSARTSAPTRLLGSALLLAAFLVIVPRPAASAQPGPLRYTLDAAASSVHARVGFFGIASKTARFPAMSGGIELDPERLGTIRLEVLLDARALEAGDTVTLARLKGPDFFDVEHYPAVRFLGHRMSMTGPVSATIDGDLTARGVTRPARLAVTFTNPPAQASGRQPLRLSARTTIDRTAFGMTAYPLIVSRKVTITIDAQMSPA